MQLLPFPAHSTDTTTTINYNTCCRWESRTNMQFNANGMGNKMTELGAFLERHIVKVAVILESKLSSNSRTPSIQNLTTLRKDRRQGQRGGSLTLIHNSINLSWMPESPETGRTSPGSLPTSTYTQQALA